MAQVVGGPAGAAKPCVFYVAQGATSTVFITCATFTPQLLGDALQESTCTIRLHAHVMGGCHRTAGVRPSAGGDGHRLARVEWYVEGGPGCTWPTMKGMGRGPLNNCLQAIYANHPSTHPTPHIHSHPLPRQHAQPTCSLAAGCARPWHDARHAHARAAQPQVYCWVDVFAVQHLPGQQQQEQPDLQEVEQVVRQAQGTLACVDASCAPFKRIWCLWEWWTTIRVGTSRTKTANCIHVCWGAGGGGGPSAARQHCTLWHSTQQSSIPRVVAARQLHATARCRSRPAGQGPAPPGPAGGALDTQAHGRGVPCEQCGTHFSRGLRTA